MAAKSLDQCVTSMEEAEQWGIGEVVGNSDLEFHVALDDASGSPSAAADL